MRSNVVPLPKKVEPMPCEQCGVRTFDLFFINEIDLYCEECSKIAVRMRLIVDNDDE